MSDQKKEIELIESPSRRSFLGASSAALAAAAFVGLTADAQQREDTRKAKLKKRAQKMETQAVTFANAPFVPVALGFFWLGYRLLCLGWSGSVWFSQDESRSQPDPGLMGFLDAGLHAVPYRHLPVDRTDVVQRLQQSGSFVYGGPRVHRLRYSLVRDGSPEIYRFQCPAGWLDGHSIPVSQHSWR